MRSLVISKMNAFTLYGNGFMLQDVLPYVYFLCKIVELELVLKIRFATGIRIAIWNCDPEFLNSYLVNQGTVVRGQQQRWRCRGRPGHYNNRTQTSLYRSFSRTFPVYCVYSDDLVGMTERE